MFIVMARKEERIVCSLGRSLFDIGPNRVSLYLLFDLYSKPAEETEADGTIPKTSCEGSGEQFSSFLPLYPEFFSKCIHG